MAMQPNPIRPTLLHMSLPEDVRTALDKHLCKRTDGKILKGAYQAFFVPLILKELERIENEKVHFKGMR